MKSKKAIGKQTIGFGLRPVIIASASVVGPDEGKGPLAEYFDLIIKDKLYGEETWEKAESKFLKEVFNATMAKAKLAEDDLDLILSGDLLNQSIAATFGLRGADVPFLGLFGACSTICESMCIGGMLISGEMVNHVACITSSHFCSAERQFRTPLELGTQRVPSAQWTVTGGGGIMLGNQGQGPEIDCVTIGKICDYGVKDPANMGAAMAPAAAETISQHFKDTGRSYDYYDMVLTGDLGYVGRELCNELLEKVDIKLGERYNDCGILIFDVQGQDMHSGGSGCGCAASVFSGMIMDHFNKGKVQNILLVGTGALFSPTSAMQGESIPAIAHAVSITTKYSC